MKPIALYPVTITQARMMSETGTRYSLDPWGGDTDRIKGETGEPDRVLVLADDVTLYPGKFGDLIAECPPLAGQAIESPAELDELITRRGHTIDSRWGYTRPLIAGEDYTTAEGLRRTP